jgi:hypothetical protein
MNRSISFCAQPDLSAGGRVGVTGVKAQWGSSAVKDIDPQASATQSQAQPCRKGDLVWILSIKLRIFAICFNDARRECNVQ